MKESLKDIDIYSEQVRDILEAPPKNILKYGIIGLFVFFTVAIALTQYIKYPDSLSMQGDLIIGQAPFELLPKTSGIVDKIYKEDKETVEVGDVLLSLRSIISEYDIEKFYSLDRDFDSVTHIPNYLNIEADQNLKLGELTPIYTSIVQNLMELQNFISDVSVFVKINSLKSEVLTIKKLNNSLSKQGEYFDQAVSLSEKDYNRNLDLEKEGVISTIEKEKTETKLLNEKRNIEEFKTRVITNDVKIQQLETQIAELTANRRNEINKRTFRINQQKLELKSKIIEWEDKNKIIAPISGQLSYNQSLEENHFVSSETPIFTIIPETNKSENIHIDGLLPISSSGTLEIGQEAIIYLENYPRSQFGTINGIVSDISILPNVGNYRVKIELHEGLKTSYDKVIPMSPLLKANVSITTKEYSLLERIFQSLIDIVKNKMQS